MRYFIAPLLVAAALAATSSQAGGPVLTIEGARAVVPVRVGTAFPVGPAMFRVTSLSVRNPAPNHFIIDVEVSGNYQ